MKSHTIQKAMLLTLSLMGAVQALSGCSAKSPAASVPVSAAQSEQAGESLEASSLSPSDSLSQELFAMDTVMSLTAYGPNAQKALDDASSEIQRLDALLSISSPDSEIRAANETGSAQLSPDTQFLIEQAQEYWKETGGLFDITIEPVMEAWGFPTQAYRVPSQEELEQLLSHVNSGQITLEGNQLSLPADVKLDLGGIAKGFTSSRVMELFRQDGLTSGIISLGGNVQTLGTKPDGSLWRIGIQDPKDLNQTFAVVQVADEAVITSGAYQRYFEENGVHYHHIIDPRTGYPSDSGLISVTIISKDGTLADALSTSLFIMGAQQAGEFWKQNRDRFDAVMMDQNGTVYVTAGLADRCQITGGQTVTILQ